MLIAGYGEERVMDFIRHHDDSSYCGCPCGCDDDEDY